MSADAALRKLLKGSGFRAVPAGPALWRLEAVPAQFATPTRPSVQIATPPAEIVVTAMKREEMLGDVPVAISIIQPDVGRGASGARDVHEMLAFTEGAITTNLGPGRDRIFLRGVADSPFNGSTQSTVNLYLDDARVSYATPDPDLRLIDIDRIELLRGPQGALYGSGALGGIVRIIPKKPDLQNWSGMAGMEASQVSHGGAGGAIEGILNAPLVSDRLALRLSGYTDQTGGWIDDRQRGKDNVNRSRRIGGRAMLGWQFADSWHADLGITAQWLNVRDSQYAFHGLARETAMAEPHDNDFLAATATISGKVGALDLTSSTAYVTHEFSSRYDATSQAGDLGLATPLGFDERRLLQLTTQEIRLSDRSASRPWVAGLTFLQAENRLTDRYLPGSGQAVTLLAQHNDSFEGALFGEVAQPLGSGWKVTVGGRAYASRVDNEQDGQARRSARQFGLTPSLTLSWHPTARRMFWLRYASAIRPGGINPDGDPGSQSFRSDDLKSIELGWRLSGTDERFRVSGSLFGLQWENVQSDVLGTDNLVRTINAGRAHNVGVELSGELRAAPWTLEANLTVQRGRLSHPSVATGALGEDTRLPILPDYAGTVKFSYAQPVGSALARGFLSVRYTGSARLSFDPLLGREMGDFWVADAGVEVVLGSLRAGLVLSNLFDQREDSFAFGNPFTIRAINQRTPVQPRTISLHLQRNF
ncbi:TonB-dependent receptor [Sphingobium sp. H39-3-25]|uniref:TonB-dependent receptor n=1 Tax=Sphingobium arseniciresistens TaxID=3030834 RepID=UPI0023B95656|nr:TonB-dependent receptor [Sphingobium arseniciresistens]